MTTQNREKYGRDVRSFHHPDDMKAVSDITNQNFANEIYADQYERENDNEEEIVNQDHDIVNNEDKEVNNIYEDDSDDIVPNSINDDPEEDYDENVRNDLATENTNKDLLDQEYDIDQDLEETDPVNHPRNFKY